MKINKKGFMLAEVVIVASVITTVLVFLYISINRMSGAYDKRNRYYSIDAMEVAMLINDSIKEIILNDVEKYQVIDNRNKLIDFYNDSSLKYTIDKIYYIKSDLLSIETLKNTLNDDELKEYIDYLEDNIDFEIYDYLILVELENTNDKDDESDNEFYFYTLKVGDTNES